MATNDINTVLDAEWSFQSSSYVPTGVSDLSTGSPTVVDLSLAGGSGMADTEAMNSDQLDFGTLLPTNVDVSATIEWFAAVTAGGTVEFYWSESANSGVGTGNPGKPDGIDGDYTGDGNGSLAESVKQMLFIGAFVTTGDAGAGIQTAKIGRFTPTMRYGQLIVVNNSGTTICFTDDIESSVLFYGTMPQVQAAA